MSSVRTRLRYEEATVPLNDVECAEYGFDVYADFDNPKTPCPALYAAVDGLLNTSGGYVKVTHKGDKAIMDKSKQKWKNKFMDDMKNKMIDKTFRKCIEYLDVDDVLYIIVKASPQIVPLLPYIHVRQGQESQAITDLQELSNNISKPTKEFVKQEISTDYDAKCTTENEHIEYKHFKHVRNLEALTAQILILGSKMNKVFFTFPNKPDGGTVVFGVEEHTATRICRVKGIPLALEEEQGFTGFLDEFMKHDPDTGESRIWGSEECLPQRGVHWNVNYLPVLGLSDTKIRKVLICIEIYHCPGGVLPHSPEVYTITEEGYLELLSYSNLKSLLPPPKVQTETVATPTNRPPIRKTAAENDETEGRKEDNNTECPVKESKTQETLAPPPQALPDIAEADIDNRLQNKSILSWSEDKRNWEKYTTSINKDEHEQIKSMKCLKGFFPCAPMSFIPREDILRKICKCSPIMEKVLTKIKTEYKNIRAFAIGSDKWLSNIPSGNIMKPSQHLADIVIVDEKAYVHLWVVAFGKVSKCEKELKAYMFHTGRVIKHGILASQKKADGEGLVIQCHLYTADGTITGNLEQTILSLVKNDSLNHQDIALALGHLFLNKETLLKTNVLNDISIKLTCEQMEQMLNIGLCRFNLIQGPPGSGKTCMSLWLAEKYKDDCVALCTTETFSKFLTYQGVNNVHIVTTGKSLTSLLKTNLLKGKSCILMDDVHNFDCDVPTWKQVFQDIEQYRTTCLYMFADHFVHNYKGSEAYMCAIQALAYHYSETGSPFNIRGLTEVHRNTKKVASFIQSCVHELGGEGPIKCSHNHEGDDVEVKRLSYTREYTERNELVQFLKKLKETETYLDPDITILVDGPNASKDAEDCRKLLTEMLKVTVHDAGTYPIQGIIVDTLQDYLGLENKVVIFMVPCGNVSQELEKESLKNPRYRAYAASRAIYRAVFVLEQLTHKVAKTFKFDNFDSLTNAEGATKDVSEATQERDPETPTWIETKEWRKNTDGGVNDVDFLAVETEKGRQLGLLQCDSRNLRMVDVDEQKIQVPLDSIGVRYVWWLAVRWDHKAVVLAHRSGEVWPGDLFWRVAVKTEDGWKTRDDVLFESEPRGVAWTEDGRVVFVDTRGKLTMFDQMGPRQWQESSTGLKNPQRITVDRRGTIYVADSGSDCIRTFSSADGKSLGTVPPTPDRNLMECPVTVCVAASGMLFVGHKYQGKRAVSIWEPGDRQGTVIISELPSVWSMSLYEDRRLAVGCIDSLHLFRIRNEGKRAKDKPSEEQEKK